jgi:hypothetical protein
MPEPETFVFSLKEATRMRRGVFAPPLLILPFTLILALDASKSQPKHFVTVFGIGLLISAVIVAIAWYGVRNQIARMSRNSLSIGSDSLILTTEFGETELVYERFEKIVIELGIRSVRSVAITQSGGKTVRLSGYENMDRLAQSLEQRLSASVVTRKRWYG